MRQHLAEVRKIADSSEPATFDNTIVAMERSGETLTRVSRIFFGLVQADTNDARQKIQEEVAPKLAAHQDEINLDPKLFARVKSIYDQRDTLELDPVQKRLVEHYYDGLVRAGAQLSDADKASLRKLNVEETTLSTQSHTRLVAATAAAAVVVDDKAKLAGLDEDAINNAAAAAKEIKGLIDDSVGKVAEGSSLVHQAGSTMGEIVASVQRVTQIMAEITEASSEQSIGIDQINRAVTQMDDVTQQNAALVEQAAAAAASLEDQAKRLAATAAFFKVPAETIIDMTAEPAPVALRPAYAA
ncbi:hypothetical protein G6F68_011115 [Rhizopus microsporus]|nr:hypothetical protein G6F68_011115 [Rhizopus microsporus]